MLLRGSRKKSEIYKSEFKNVVICKNVDCKMSKNVTRYRISRKASS